MEKTTATTAEMLDCIRAAEAQARFCLLRARAAESDAFEALARANTALVVARASAALAAGCFGAALFALLLS